MNIVHGGVQAVWTPTAVFHAGAGTLEVRPLKVHLHLADSVPWNLASRLAGIKNCGWISDTGTNLGISGCEVEDFMPGGKGPGSTVSNMHAT